MNRIIKQVFFLVIFSLIVIGCQKANGDERTSVQAPAATPQAGEQVAQADGGAAVDGAAGEQAAPAANGAAGPHPALLDPSLATEQAPDSFKARFETTEGAFVIQFHRSWSPAGVDRVYNLIKIGFYNDVAFFRVIEGFMAQFGMHGDPRVTAAWANATIPDDPVIQSNTRGRVTFAKRGIPNSRSTQLFVNYRDNNRLDGMGFAPIGDVIEGLEIVDALHSGYGEGAPQGRGPAQMSIHQRGNEYLRGSFPDLDYIKSVTIIE